MPILDIKSPVMVLPGCLPEKETLRSSGKRPSRQSDRGRIDKDDACRAAAREIGRVEGQYVRDVAGPHGGDETGIVDLHARDAEVGHQTTPQIGRASRRERGEISVVA